MGKGGWVLRIKKYLKNQRRPSKLACECWESYWTNTEEYLECCWADTIHYHHCHQIGYKMQTWTCNYDMCNLSWCLLKQEMVFLTSQASIGHLSQPRVVYVSCEAWAKRWVLWSPMFLCAVTTLFFFCCCFGTCYI